MGQNRGQQPNFNQQNRNQQNPGQQNRQNVGQNQNQNQGLRNDASRGYGQQPQRGLAATPSAITAPAVMHGRTAPAGSRVCKARAATRIPGPTVVAATPQPIAAGASAGAAVARQEC